MRERDVRHGWTKNKPFLTHRWWFAVLSLLEIGRPAPVFVGGTENEGFSLRRLGSQRR
jgi:hypothetical protein